jgi:hypothetical protein
MASLEIGCASAPLADWEPTDTSPEPVEPADGAAPATGSTTCGRPCNGVPSEVCDEAVDAGADAGEEPEPADVGWRDPHPPTAINATDASAAVTDPRSTA